MGEWSLGRRNVIGNDDELDQRLARIVEHFGEHWLSIGGAHPIRRAWHRRDAIATSELYTLGEALERIAMIDPAWLARKVQTIRLHKSANNTRGALFEILSLSYLANASYKVVPAREAHPGYDAAIEHGNSAKRNLSLKSLKLSKHGDLFEQYAQKTKDQLLKVAKGAGVRSFSAHIIARGRYPEAHDWDALYRELSKSVSAIAAGPVKREIGDQWYFVLAPLAVEGTELDSDYLSHSILILAPYHQNEAANVLSRVEQACANLARHGVGKAKNELNELLLRLPTTIAIPDVLQWIELYFKSHPNKEVHGAILYQPAIVRDAVGSKGNSVIQHCVVEKFGQRGEEWHAAHPNARLSFTFPVGTCSTEPGVLELRLGEIVHTIVGHYFYQHGEQYHKGTTEGTVSSPAPGVRTHLILDPPNIDGGRLLLSGHFAEDEGLLLI